MKAADPLVIRSQSGQFLVRGLPVGWSRGMASTNSSKEWVRLDPSVLAVSAERVKQTMLTGLGLSDQWHGTISMILHSVVADNEPIRVTSLRSRDGWNFRVELPEVAPKQRVLKTITQVLLMEMANRRSGERPAELPPWLGEGLLAHWQATSLATLTLEPLTGIDVQGQRRDPFAEVRECLRTNTPLTLDELNWPTAEQRYGTNAMVYRSCAHLFVYELLNLQQGPACLRDMLARLHQYRNWQTAFLRAFEPCFKSLLEVDKWWALNVVNLTGKDPFSLWPEAESQARLEDCLLTTVDVRTNSKELPLSTDVRLQQVISQWEPARQAPVLRHILNQLQALRPRVVPEVAGLIDQYYVVLDKYLRALAPDRSKNDGRIKDTVKALEVLDATREQMRGAASFSQANAFESR